jgi:hypothetical protein
MPSKREGSIQPSVSSQPPRFTARIGGPGVPAAASFDLLASDRGRSHGEQTRRRRMIWRPALLMVVTGGSTRWPLN